MQTSRLNKKRTDVKNFQKILKIHFDRGNTTH